MSELPSDLARRYAAALANYLADGGEAARLDAHEIGRAALQAGFGLLDIATQHHEALATVFASRPAAVSAGMMKAAEFLTETLSTFEMTLRGYQETNARLVSLNQTLRLAHAETKAAHEKLVAEIGERQRVEEAMRQSQKLQAIGRLAGGVAHDFNNLLTIVLGNLDAAARHKADGETLQEILARARRAAERGAKVTSQLLSFSRQQLLSPEIIEPSTRLRDLITLLKPSLRGDIAIETAIPDDLWAIEIDPTQLELALINLGLNARDAMPNGGIFRVAAANRTVVDERLNLAGNYLVIEVADTGTGIARELLPRVFDPFFTTKPVGAGSGLGLSQVHGFAHQSFGAVEIESELGKGTTVRLYLPASPVAAAAPEPTHVSEAHEHPETGTVLVVEDDLDIGELAAKLLRDCGFTVKLVGRARAALDILHRGEGIDLIFSDIMMPDGMNGIDLAEEVKSRYPAIPVLLATGYSDAAGDAGSKGLPILAKPYRAQELCACVIALLGARRS
jgi:signal transduction histidine kinase/CheY-like chemotaxis protein